MIHLPNLRIRAKIMLSLVVVVPCVVFMSVMLVRYQSLSQQRWRLVRQSITVIGKTDEVMLQLATMNASVSEFVLTNGDAYLTDYRAASERFDQLRQELQPLIATDVGQTTRLDEMERSVTTWRTSVLEPAIETPRLLPTSGRGTLPSFMVEPSAVGQFASLRARVADFRATQTSILNQRTAQAELASARVRQILIGGPVLIVIVGIIILALVASHLGRRISLIAQAAQTISEGKLDHAHRLPGGQDEVGMLAAAFKHMADTIRGQIAQQQRTEEELRENEKIYRLMAENATDMIARLTVDGIYLYASPACRKLMGFGPEELVGQSAYTYFHPADATINASAPVLDGLDTTPAEYRVRRKDGSYVWVESISRAVYDLDTGMMLEIHVTTRDITERKGTEVELRARDQLFHTAFEDAATGMALVGLDGRWLRLNRAISDIVGYSSDELLRLDFQTITHPDDLDADLDLLNRLLRGEIRSYQLEKRYLHKDGRIVWVLLSVSLVRDENGKPMHFISQIQDIAERKRAEAEVKNLNRALNGHIAELEQTTHELGTLSDLVDQLHVCESEQEAYAVINTSIVPLFPHDAGALSIVDDNRGIVRTVVVWGGYDDADTFTTNDCWTLRCSQPYLADTDHPKVSCAHFDHDAQASTFCVPMMARGEILGVLHLKQLDGGTISTAKQRLVQTVADDLGLLVSNLGLRESLRLQSIRDPLTGLFNRRYMEESFQRELNRAERRGLPVGVMMFDIDRFKRINDRFGHPGGDHLLREVALCVQRYVRTEDIACRYGGEEFAVIMTGSTLETMQERAEAIRQAIRSLPVQYLDQPLGQVTGSFGVAVYPTHGHDPATLLAAADAALYQAKRTGRDRVVSAASMHKMLEQEGLRI